MDRRPARLKRRSDFLRVAGAARKWVAPGLILQVRPHDRDRPTAAALPPLRVGFTVSRKVGGAVVRNRARRRLHAVVANVMPAHAAPGRDYVLIGRAGTIRRPFRDLTGDLETALKRLGSWRDGCNGTDRDGSSGERRSER
jgi:ribonuclease P protein component